MSDTKVLDQQSFNTECPICFSENGKMIMLSCFHRFHEECLGGHTNLNCPQCRQHVVNWPPLLKEKIEKNSKKFQSELDEEERQNILENELQENRRFLSRVAMILQPPPQVEVETALQYLRDNGIPMRYLPRKIKIVVRRGQPRMDPGILFNAIISQVMEHIHEDIKNNIANASEEDDGCFIFSEDEDPFLEENEDFEDVDFSCSITQQN